METNRRFRRPPLVIRAVRVLAGLKSRARAAANGPAQGGARRQRRHLKLVPGTPPPASGTEEAVAAGAAAEAPPRPRRVRNTVLLVMLAAVVLAGLWLTDEARSFRVQARYFARLADQATFKVEPGPSAAIRYPSDSPYDARLGYANLPDYLKRLQARGFEVTAQARFSPTLLELADKGINPPYREKTQAGLEIDDAHHQALFRSTFPERVQ
jgi:hypothetical protein